jgi:hypothetical protein
LTPGLRWKVDLFPLFPHKHKMVELDPSDTATAG